MLNVYDNRNADLCLFGRFLGVFKWVAQTNKTVELRQNHKKNPML